MATRYTFEELKKEAKVMLRNLREWYGGRKGDYRNFRIVEMTLVVGDNASVEAKIEADRKSGTGSHVWTMNCAV